MTASGVRRNSKERHKGGKSCVLKSLPPRRLPRGGFAGVGRIGYTLAPAGPADPRNNYVPQSGAVFIVDNAKGVISMCFPDNTDNKVVVVCSPATKLP